MSTRNGNGPVISRRTTIGDLPELLGVDEVATWLNVGRNTAYELIRRGDIKSIRIGRLLRVPRAALAEMTR